MGGPDICIDRFLEPEDVVRAAEMAIAESPRNAPDGVHEPSELELAVDTDKKWPETPTMNFGKLTPDSDDEAVRRAVLHEFGPALGCIHEHLNPSGGIPWEKEEFDPESIMVYAIPQEHTIGDFEVGWNTTLSAKDREMIARVYPKAGPQP